MNYRVTHRTVYRYDQPASLCQNEARLAPRSLTHQACHEHRVNIEPMAADYRERLDFFGNKVAYFSVQEPHGQLTITASSRVNVQAPAALPTDMPWEEARLAPGRPDREARLYAMASTLVDSGEPGLLEYARPSFLAGRPLLEAAEDLMRRIHADFKFDPLSTTVSTPLADVLRHRRGVCQDFAHFGLGCLRALGLAARYVSGYIETLPPPGRQRLVGADASHAWFAVYAPGWGWTDFDPTNDMRPGERHVTVAWGRDYADVAPLKGVVFGGGAHRLEVSVDVEPLLD